ncbi:MAG: hypothetical protein KAT62_09395 [Desulfuromonadales bacterium]|nr:hypothetical protein [Desulfuromonadales bacterium]
MISHNRMILLIFRFRDLCLQSHPEDIEVLARDERDKLMGIAMQGDLTRMLRIGITAEPIENIYRLAKTPRLLKTILRKTYRAWERIHGEIDFDDILVANTIRFGAPEAFEFLLEHHEEIRGLQTDGAAVQNSAARLNAVEDKWARTSENANWDTVSAKSLAQFLFPCWHTLGIRTAESNQKIQTSMPTDYWLRYLMEELEPDAIRDQEVLHAFTAWRENADGACFRNTSLPLALCTDGEFTSKFEYFALLALEGQDIRQIASSTFEQALALQGVEAFNDSIAGFSTLWRLAMRQPIEEATHLDWVKNEIYKALPISFRFANSIYYYWNSNTEGDIHKESHRIEFHSQIVDHAKEMFEGSPTDYLRVIDPNFMYSSYHFCVLHSEPKQGGAGFNAADWHWFAKLLLDAGEINPQAIVPQIVPFVVKETHRIVSFGYNFDEEASKELFGDEISRLMHILSIEISLEPFDLREQRRIKSANEVASKWLEENQ